MAVIIHDWDNNSSDFKKLGTHNSRYLVRGIDWYKYYIYPNTKGNIRTGAFEFYPYEDSSSGPVPMSVIVDNYDNKNAITYPLEYNLTLDRYPTGWGVKNWNVCKIIRDLKYSRTTADGNYDFCPVVLEPGYAAVYKDSNITKTIVIDDGETIKMFDDHLEIAGTRYDPEDFKDGALPARVLVEIQAAGGGGGGGQNTAFVYYGAGAAGGGAGGYACFILNLKKSYHRSNDWYSYYEFHRGSYGTGGRSDGGDGGPANPSSCDFYSYTYGYSNTTNIVTVNGGSGGHGATDGYYPSAGGSGGDVSFNSSCENDYYWEPHSIKGGNGGYYDEASSKVDSYYFNTFINNNYKGGSEWNTVGNASKDNGEHNGGYGGNSASRVGARGAYKDSNNNVPAGNGLYGSGGGAGYGYHNLNQTQYNYGKDGGAAFIYVYLPLKK